MDTIFILIILTCLHIAVSIWSFYKKRHIIAMFLMFASGVYFDYLLRVLLR